MTSSQPTTSSTQRLSRRLALAALALSLLLAVPPPAAAQAPPQVPTQSWPSKPVRVLVPYAAGGAVDVLARTLGQALAKPWGQQLVVDNRPGAGGIIASQALIQSAPDGTTLLLVASGHPLNQFFYPKLPYTSLRFG